MKIKSIYIFGLLFFALTTILSLQLLWLYNMYYSHYYIINKEINECFLNSIDQEYHKRRMELGGPTTTNLTPEKYDPTEKSKSRVELEDTTFIVEYNSTNLYDIQKLNQLILNYIIPFNQDSLTIFFQKNLEKERIPFINTMIEYHNEEKDTIIYSNFIKKDWRYQLYETDPAILDLTESMYVKAYVETNYYFLFRKMVLQLFLSFILITAVIYCLFKLSKTIFQQRKEQEIKQGFINTMTHELKRPITSSLAMLEFVLDGIKENDFSSVDEFIADSIFSLQKLNTYVEKIQEISKGEEGKIEFEWQLIELNSFVNKLTKKYDDRTDKLIHFKIEIQEDINFQTDILHFSNIIDNLIENSIKYSDKEVVINIKAYILMNNIIIHYKDNGWGISELEKKRIFEKFFRSNSAEKRKKSGFGLGLSYVHLIIQNMGGKIKVESKEKEFTEFIIYLPEKR